MIKTVKFKKIGNYNDFVKLLETRYFKNVGILLNENFNLEEWSVVSLESV
jgi:hypothetical protein